MSISVTYKRISDKRTHPRNHKIDTITIHCYCSVCTAKQGVDSLCNSGRAVSCNYVVGYDGSIGMCVPEEDRSWCSSNAVNDHRAITIEVASTATEPYTVSDKAYKALIALVADVCQRNGIKKLVWSWDKQSRVNHLNGCNMTVHRDYANKSCPGQYLYERMDKIAQEVNALLSPQDGAKLWYTDGAAIVPQPPCGTAGRAKYTIVETRNGYGKLKSGAGWVRLSDGKMV